MENSSFFNHQDYNAHHWSTFTYLKSSKQEFIKRTLVNILHEIIQINPVSSKNLLADN